MPVDLTQFDLPLTDLENQLAFMVKEAMELRFQDKEGMALAISSPKTLVESLLRVRARLDRLEELLAVAMRARGRAIRAAQEARRLADEAWDRTSVTARQTPGRRGGDYIGAKEHYADNNLATLTEQRASRVAERLSDHASEVYDVIRLAHRGLDGYRNDHLTVMRAMAFESHLERATSDRGY